MASLVKDTAFLFVDTAVSAKEIIPSRTPLYDFLLLIVLFSLLIFNCLLFFGYLFP